MAEKVPVCVSVGRGGAKELWEQVLCPLVSYCMLERVCHRWGLGCQEGVSSAGSLTSEGAVQDFHSFSFIYLKGTVHSLT